MQRSRIAALVMGGFLALGVAACGGSAGSGSSQAGSTPVASAASSAPSTQASSTKPADSGTSLTPPGTKLGFNQQARVGWVPPSKFSISRAHKAIPLEVSVEGIERGTLSDFKNVQLDANERSATPYYVKVRVTNLGAGGGSANDDPALAFRAIDDRGQPQSSVTFIGDFQRCNDTLPPKPFSHGKSFDTCLTYLMPGGGSIQSVDWNDGPSSANAVTPYFEKPVVWSGAS
jgi:hypothetical protein